MNDELNEGFHYPEDDMSWWEKQDQDEEWVKSHREMFDNEEDFDDGRHDIRWPK